MDSENKNFTFQNGNEKIIFEILTSNQFLIENTLTRTKFKFENIDPKTVYVSGKTIRYFNERETKENEILILMSPKNEDLENGNLKVTLSYRSQGKLQNFVLSIPVKKE